MLLRIRIGRDGDTNNEEREFSVLPVTIGRAPGNALQLPSDIVSKTHGRIEIRNQACQVLDLKSLNGTFLNGEEIVSEKPYSIHLGDRVRVGDYLLTLTAMDLALTPGGEQPAEVISRPTPEPLPPINPPGLVPGPDESATREIASQSYLVDIVQDLLIAFSRLTEGRRRFYEMFLKVSVQRDTQFSGILLASRQDLLRLVLDPALTPEQRAERRAILGQALERVVLHYTGLIDGYRGSIESGVPQLLRQLDPGVLLEKLRPGTWRLRFLAVPVIGDLMIARLMKKELRRLTLDDRGHIEEWYFRPSFKKAYDAFVESKLHQVHRADTDI